MMVTEISQEFVQLVPEQTVNIVFMTLNIAPSVLKDTHSCSLLDMEIAQSFVQLETAPNVVPIALIV